MLELNPDKTKLYKTLTNDLTEIDAGYYRIKDILKRNSKYIRDLRDDVDRWKETCWRQSDHIHKLYLISAIQFLTIIGLTIWISMLLIIY